MENDFLIFPLSRNVSEDRLPNGTILGYLKFDTQSRTLLPIHFVGTNRDFKNGRSVAYESCESYRQPGTIYHNCGTSITSSPSSITRMINGELVLTAIHRGEATGEGRVRPTPSNIKELNRGLPAENVLEYLDALVSIPAENEISL